MAPSRAHSNEYKEPKYQVLCVAGLLHLYYFNLKARQCSILSFWCDICISFGVFVSRIAIKLFIYYHVLLDVQDLMVTNGCIGIFASICRS